MQPLISIAANIFHLTLLVVGLALLYTEVKLIKYNGPSEPNTDGDIGILFFFGPMSYFIMRAPWYALGVFLAIRSHAQPNQNFDEAGIGTYVVLSALIIGVLRLVYVRYTLLYSNKHQELVGLNRLTLKGHHGILVKEVTPTSTGTVRLEGPECKNDEIDCIADESIPSGAYVEVIEVDCDLIKVEKVKSHVHAPST